MEPNVLGDIDFFDQIDDLINFPFDDENGCCNNLLLAGSAVDCKDFPIYTADDALIPDDCEPLLCRGRIDRSTALFVPFEDIVKPEWPSTVVTDSSSGKTFQKETILSGSSSSSSSSGSNSSCSDEKTKIPLEPYRWGPQHARTKRPRPKNPYDPKKSAINRLVMISPSSPTSSLLDAGQEHTTEKKVTKKIKTNDSKRYHGVMTRKCLHCEITSTPQWRAGPMGPKTLCNACGVRYKSGRLYPEYRPAASPTFVSALHSNSHKKVLEMRSKVGHDGIEATNDANDATIETYRD